MRPPPLSFLQVKPPCPAPQPAPEEHGTPASAPARWSLFVVVDDTAFRPTVGTELPAQLPAAGPGRTHRHRELRSGLTASEAGPPGHRALRGRPGGDGGLWRRPPGGGRETGRGATGLGRSRASSPGAERGRRAQRSGARLGRGLPPGRWGPGPPCPERAGWH